MKLIFNDILYMYWIEYAFRFKFIWSWYLMIFYACIGLNMHLGSNSFGVDISWYFIHVSDWICIFKFKCIWSWYTLKSKMHRSDLNLFKRRKVYIEAYIYLTWYMHWIKYALDFKYIEVDMYWIYKKSGWIKFQNNV